MKKRIEYAVETRPKKEIRYEWDVTAAYPVNSKSTEENALKLAKGEAAFLTAERDDLRVRIVRKEYL
jgi:hypothetical protein